MATYRDTATNTWRFRFTFGGKRWSGSTTEINTKAAAIELERAMYKRVAARRFVGVMHTVADFSERFVDHQSARTKPMSMIVTRNALTHILPAIGRLKLDAVSKRDIDALVTEWSKSFAPKSVNVWLGVLRRMFAIAIEWEIIDRMPKFARVDEPKKAHRFLAEDEATRLLAAAKPRWRSMMLVGLRTGLRVGELRGLEVADVNLDRRTLQVRRTDPGRIGMPAGPPKGNRERTVPLTPETVRILRDVVAEARKRKTARLWVSSANEARTRSEASCCKAFTAAAKKAGIAGSGVSWHTLRHTCASWLVMRKVPLRAVQSILGHASISVTEGYSHLSDSFTHEQVDLLDFALVSIAGNQGGAKALPPGVDALLIDE